MESMFFATAIKNYREVNKLTQNELAKKLNGEEEQQEFVILDTEFGEKTFRLCDIKGIYLVNAEGHKVEITNYIKEKLH